jgi:signal transduction histidine kinase
MEQQPRGCGETARARFEVVRPGTPGSGGPGAVHARSEHGSHEVVGEVVRLPTAQPAPIGADHRACGRMAAAMEEERKRIARDIHDDTLQTLGAMALRLDLLREEIPGPRQREVIEHLLALARDASERLRSIVFELRSDHLEEGLVTAIGAATRDQALQAGIEHRVTGRLTANPPLEVALALYRIAQEALTNVRKHGRATRVDVSLAEEGGALRLCVVDDGKGFDVVAATEKVPAGQTGARRFGLRSMRERAQLAGGRLTVTSVPGQGTVVEARIPVGIRTGR